jgi:hypothetical protein
VVRISRPPARSACSTGGTGQCAEICVNSAEGDHKGTPLQNLHNYGHTTRHRLLFAGDTILPLAMALYGEECLPWGVFHRPLQRRQEFGGEFDLLLPAHVDLAAWPANPVKSELAQGRKVIVYARRSDG